MRNPPPERDPDGNAPMPARHEALPLGTRLDEYEIRAVLGEGPLGCVYLVSESGGAQLQVIREYLPVALAARGDGPLVALRSVTGSPDGSANTAAYRQGLRAFVNEGLLLAHLNHSALLRVQRTWEANHTAYMLLPRYESTTLAAARAAMAAPPAEGWVRHLIRSLSGALTALHGESCLHRNVSPEHVLVLRDGRPLLLGPRAALQVLGDTAQSSLIQPGYSPIEEYGESAQLHQGPWTDVYALAALARFVILGSAPMPAPARAVGDPMEPLAIAVQALRVRHPSVEYSASLLLAIDYAMAVDPRDRPQTLEDFQEVLDNTEHAPIPETSDSEHARLEASLGAMIDEVLIDAPPMRTHPPARAPRHASMPAPPHGPAHPPPSAQPPTLRTQVEPTWGHTAPAVPGGRTIPSLLTELDLGPATDPLSAHLDTEPSFDAQTTAPGALLVDPLDTPVVPAATPAIAPAPLPPSAFGTPPSMRPRPTPSPWPKRAGIAAVLLVVLGVAGWQWRERSAKPPGPSEQVLQRATEQIVPSPAASAARVVTESPVRVAPVEPASTATPVATPVATAAPAPAASVPTVSPPAAPAPAPTAPAPASTPAAVTPPAPTLATAPASTAAVAPAPSPTPARARAEPPAPAPAKPRAATPREAAPAPAPRTACAGRSDFSLYRCMQQQCAKPPNADHAQCKRLRETDQVD